jgi:hypothetical protein
MPSPTPAAEPPPPPPPPRLCAPAVTHVGPTERHAAQLATGGRESEEIVLEQEEEQEEEQVQTGKVQPLPQTPAVQVQALPARSSIDKPSARYAASPAPTQAAAVPPTAVAALPPPEEAPPLEREISFGGSTALASPTHTAGRRLLHQDSSLTHVAALYSSPTALRRLPSAALHREQFLLLPGSPASPRTAALEPSSPASPFGAGTHELEEQEFLRVAARIRGLSSASVLQPFHSIIEVGVKALEKEHASIALGRPRPGESPLGPGGLNP